MHSGRRGVGVGRSAVIMACDALLCFRDPLVEVAFWASARDRLCSLDRLTTFVVLLNNAFMVLHHGVSLVRMGALNPAFFSFATRCVMFNAMLQLIVLWLVTRHREEYYRRRDAIVVASRLVRYVAAVGITVGIAARGEDAFIPSAHYTPPHGLHVYLILFKSLAHRGLAFWANFATFFWPLRFSLHFGLHTVCCLPTLMHAAGCLAREAFLHPLLRQPVCSVASRLNWHLQSPGSGCHPLAPHLVAYSVRAQRPSPVPVTRPCMRFVS